MNRLDAELSDPLATMAIMQCINEACLCSGIHVVNPLRFAAFFIRYHGAAIVVPIEKEAAA